jgi:death-on-curing protein
MTEPVWIDRRALLYLHSASLAMFGGEAGVRDTGLLESALARPRNRFHYDEGADLAALAASYGFGLAKNHPFVDGNKRAAFHAIGLFLAIDKCEFRAGQVESIQNLMALASGELNEEELGAWIRRNSECQP